MTYTLVLCWGMFLATCGSVREYEFPSYEACDKERAVQMAAPVKPYYAVCRPGKPTPR